VGRYESSVLQKGRGPSKKKRSTKALPLPKGLRRTKKIKPNGKADGGGVEKRLPGGKEKRLERWASKKKEHISRQKHRDCGEEGVFGGRKKRPRLYFFELREKAERVGRHQKGTRARKRGRPSKKKEGLFKENHGSEEIGEGGCMGREVSHECDKTRRKKGGGDGVRV